MDPACQARWPAWERRKRGTAGKPDGSHPKALRHEQGRLTKLEPEPVLGREPDMAYTETKREAREVARQIVALEERCSRATWSDDDKREFEGLVAQKERLMEKLEAENILRSESVGRDKEPVFGEKEKRSAAGVPYDYDVTDANPDPEKRGFRAGESIVEHRKRLGLDAEWYNSYGDLTAAQFFRARITGPQTPLEQRALSEATDAAGKVTVPTPLYAQVIDSFWPQTVLAPARARVMPMDSQTLKVPAIDTQPSGDWLSEGSTTSSTGPTYRAVTLTAKTYRGIIKASNELVDDSVGLEESLYRELTGLMAYETNRVALEGASTSGGPEGIWESTSISSQGVSGSTAGQIDWKDLALGWKTLAENNARLDKLSAIVSPRTYTTLGVTRAGSSNIWLPKPGILDRVSLYPTATMLNNKSVGASTGLGWVALGDFRDFAVGMRMRPQIVPLRERYSHTFQTGFAFHMRMDCAPLRTASFLKLTNIST